MVPHSLQPSHNGYGLCGPHIQDVDHQGVGGGRHAGAFIKVLYTRQVERHCVDDLGGVRRDDLVGPVNKFSCKIKRWRHVIIEYSIQGRWKGTVLMILLAQ